MKVVALVTENKHGMAVDLFATEAAALADVKRELHEHFDLDLGEATDWTAADLGQWIGEEGHTYNFTMQDIDAPGFRVTTTDLTTGAVLDDRLVDGHEITDARAVAGVAWNRFGFGHTDREVVIWSAASDDPVERITAN